MKIALVGGGSSAHLLAVLLSGQGHQVKVLTSKPKAWSHEIELETNNGILRGYITKADDDPVGIVGDAQLAIFCMPVHQYPVAARRLMPLFKVNKDCIVGTVYGQAGFDWIMYDEARKQNIEPPRHFAIGLLPWIARVKEYGKSVVSYGPKMRNGIATSDLPTYEYLQNNILDDFSFNYWGCGKFEKVPNFVTLALTVDNQIIHPSRCYALMCENTFWKTQEDIPYFYRDWDDYSSKVLKDVDADYTLVRASLMKKLPFLSNSYDFDYLGLEHWSYGSHNPDIKASFVNSQTLGLIKPPVALGADGFWHLDVEHRFFKDDFAFGLEIAKWFAKELACEVPHIDKLLKWFESDIKPHMRGKVERSCIQKFHLNELFHV